MQRSRMNKMFSKLLNLSCLFCSLAMAQQASPFNQAPPAIHKALIANVTQFFQNYVDGKFRQCIPLVAEESQDDFFNVQKDKYRSFEIIKVDYKDDFHTAVVTVTIGITHMFRGTGMPLMAPIASNWKLEKGEWRWFVDKTFTNPTAFGGAMKPGEGDRTGKLANRPENTMAVLSQVKVSKQDVMLSSFEASKDEVLISNDMPGVINFTLQTEELPGLKVALEKKELKAGEKTRLLLTYKPADKSPKPMRRALVVVEQTGVQIPISITFAVPKEALQGVPVPAK